MANKIRNISSRTFEHLTSLQHLDLSDVNLEYIEDDTFGKCRNLKKIFLMDNDIKTINSKIFEKLNNLELIVFSVSTEKHRAIKKHFEHKKSSLLIANTSLKTIKTIDKITV